jgi:long-subunit fatty acid transport protein
MRRFSKWLVPVVLLVTRAASANLQPPTTYDARSAGLGGSGVAYAEGVAAAFHNPANLDSVKQLDVGLTLTPLFATSEGPFLNPGFFASPASGFTQTVKSALAFAPLFQLGAAYRVHEQAVLGLVVQVPAGGGGTFNGVHLFADQEFSAQAAQGEVNIPLSIKLLDELSIGLAYRATYVTQSFKGAVVNTSPPPPTVPVDMTLSGTGWKGLQAGVNIKPMPGLAIGLNWRSRSDVKLTGKGLGGQDATDYFNVPHSFQGGLAFSGVDKLMVSVQYSLWLYEQSSKGITPSANAFPPGGATKATWDNAHAVAAGVEYRVTDTLPLRLGYQWGTSATNVQSATPFLPAPGMAHTGTLGVGLDLGGIDLNLAVSGTYLAGSVPVFDPAANPAGIPAAMAGAQGGDYKTKTFGAYVGVVYHL